MLNIKNILKGLLIGTGKIIPGVSGSLIALNLGIYEKLINSICNYFSDIKTNTAFLLNVGSGILISIILGSRIINYLLIDYYFITMMLFIGLIIGTTKEIIREVNLKNKKEFVFFIITFIFMIILSFIKIKNNYNYTNNIFNNLFIILIGMIDAATMIIPGISGTAIFILIGCYNFILLVFSNPLSNIIISFFFIIGLFLGTIITTKIMNYLLNKKKEIIYPIILGFSLSSIFILLVKTLVNYSGNLILGILLFLIGYKISLKIS